MQPCWVGDVQVPARPTFTCVDTIRALYTSAGLQQAMTTATITLTIWFNQQTATHTSMGSTSADSAKALILAGMVALNMSVWRWPCGQRVWVNGT